MDKFQLVLVFVAVITGTLSATYFYLESNIFMHLLQKPLKMIASGMFVISLGVMLSAYISYAELNNMSTIWGGVPAPALFYWLYLFGSILIAFGAKQFARKPAKLA